MNEAILRRKTWKIARRLGTVRQMHPRVYCDSACTRAHNVPYVLAGSARKCVGIAMVQEISTRRRCHTYFFDAMLAFAANSLYRTRRFDSRPVGGAESVRIPPSKCAQRRIAIPKQFGCRSGDLAPRGAQKYDNRIPRVLDAIWNRSEARYNTQELGSST
jgi:hypothetical protein